MPVTRETKPVLDAVNDAIASLSDLLHSLRTHARQAARETKASAKVAKGHAVRAGHKAVEKAEDTRDTLLDRATRAWHDLKGDEDAAPTTPTNGASRRAKPKRKSS